MENLKRRLRDAAHRVKRGLWKQLTLVLMVLVGTVLSRVDPSYNHIIGAYGLVGLLALNVKVWRGEASTFDARLPATLLAAGLWMWWHGNADIVPYLGTLLFALTAAVCILHLALRRPLTFRDDSRAAENYLDTAARGLLALASVAMGVAWIPEPRYLAVPFTLLLVFSLAVPLRRLLYPLMLKAVGLVPTSGRVRGPAVARRRDLRWRIGFAAVSLLVGAFLAPRLVFTRARYEVSIPKLYALPVELLQQRRAELEPYVAEPPGSLDVAALTELGLVLHDLGLSNQADLERARSVLQRALFLDPGNAQAMAWHGTTLTAGAIYDEPPLRRMRFISDGLAELDRAVQRAPDDPIVRLARLNVCLGLPPFARRLATAREDVDHLLELARTHPRETDPILPLVYERAGDAYARMGESEKARGYWRAALAELPDPSPAYEAVAAQIAGLEPPRDAVRAAEGLRGADARPSRVEQRD